MCLFIIVAFASDFSSHLLLKIGIVDTQIRTHDLIKEDDLNDHPCTPKNHNSITYINLSLHYKHQFIHCVFALHAPIHSLHIIKMILRC